MIERVLLTLILLLAGIAAYAIFRQVHLRRLGQVWVGETVASEPTILYFRSDSCAVCPTQHRYLDQLRETWHGRFAVEQIDVDIEQETAVKYGVFTLPTTLVVDGTGAVRQINYGLTNTRKLRRQLETLL